MANYDRFGREVPDQTPVEMPLGFKRPRPLNEVVQELIRKEFSRQAEAQGQETFDEANDFDVDDDEFPVSPHELLDDEQEFRRAEQAMLDKAQQDMDNERTVNKDRIKENEDGGQAGTRSGRNADGASSGGNVRKGMGKKGEQRKASGDSEASRDGGGEHSEAA